MSFLRYTGKIIGRINSLCRHLQPNILGTADASHNMIFFKDPISFRITPQSVYKTNNAPSSICPDVILLCSSMIKRKNCPVIIPPFRAKGAKIKQGEHFLVYSIVLLNKNNLTSSPNLKALSQISQFQKSYSHTTGLSGVMNIQSDIPKEGVQ